MLADHDNDERRLETLADLDILDTPREIAFDRITALTRKLFRVPMSTLTFIDGHRQWFKSADGLEDRERERRPALCNFAIGQNEPLIVPDTHRDPRFADNVFVRGRPFIRFYAGAQLKISGVNVGTLCAMDTNPREFNDESVAMLMDLAAIAVDELTLRNLTLQDSLTGTLSRRGFRSEGERLASLAKRQGHKLTCAVFDIDHFKSINDRFGHAIGDAALVAVAQACRSSLRASDVIGRLGGEEFGILLPHTDLADGIAVLEKTRRTIQASLVETPCGPLQVTCSVGGAAFSGQPFEDTLRCADLAMYSAKDAGHNKVIAWVDAAPPLSPATRRVFKSGQITFNAGRSSFDCTVRKLSDESATLEVLSTADIPLKFKLAIASEGLSRACRLISKSDKKLEIAFL